MDIEKRAQLGNECHATLTSRGGLTMESQCSFAAYKITDKMRERIHLPFILYKTELLGGRSRKYSRSVADAISHRMRTIVREKAIPHAWAEPRAMLVLVIASSRSSTTAPRVQRSMRENVRDVMVGSARSRQPNREAREGDWLKFPAHAASMLQVLGVLGYRCSLVEKRSCETPVHRQG